MNKKFEDYIKSEIDYWKPVLGLDLQFIEVEFDKDTEFLAMGCCYPYNNPVLFYSEKAINKFEKGILDKTVILHELCHFITDPLYVKAVERYVSKGEVESERERLTDTISNIVYRLKKINSK